MQGASAYNRSKLKKIVYACDEYTILVDVEGISIEKKYLSIAEHQ